MKRIYTLLSTVILLITLCVAMAISASAATAPTFQDVTENSPWYDGIAYAVKNEITLGTGNNSFSPDAPITARQWAVMICRAYDKEVIESDCTFGQAQLNLAYREGWLNVGAMVEPDIEMCRSAVYESAFAVADLDIYRYELYNDGKYMPAADNYIRIGYENGLCAEDAVSQDLVTRGEAIQIIYLMQIQGLQNDPPEMIDQLNINNVDQVHLETYLLEFKKIPEVILDEYLERGWTFHVNSQYLENLSKRLNMQCAGVTVYQQHVIYARQPYCTVHEFGHFYHQVLGFPAIINNLYTKESEATRNMLGDYSTTNHYEYFAEFFEYWINWRDNESRMHKLEEAAPETYAYFLTLENSGWC